MMTPSEFARTYKQFVVVKADGSYDDTNPITGKSREYAFARISTALRHAARNGSFVVAPSGKIFQANGEPITIGQRLDMKDPARCPIDNTVVLRASEQWPVCPECSLNLTGEEMKLIAKIKR